MTSLPHLAAAATLLLTTPLAAQQVDTTAYLGAAVVDVAAGTATGPATLLVSAGRIVDVRPGLDSTGATRVVHVEGYLVPGLIDAHVHFPDAVAARRALRSGVTAVRIMGSWDFAGVAIRDSSEARPWEYPAVRTSGYHIRRTMPAQFDSVLQGDRIRNTADLRRVVEIQLAGGVDAVKIGGDSTVAPAPTVSIWKFRWRRFLRFLGLRPSLDEQPLADFDPGPTFAPMFTREEYAQVVALAAGADLPVVVHANGDRSVRDAALAGVRSVEHGTWLSDTTLAILARENVFFVPSLSLAEFRGHGTVHRIRAVTREAQHLGVPMAAGSDTDYFHEGPTLAQELQALTRAGLTAAEALRTGTMGGAVLLGWEGTRGLLRPGYEADFLVVLDDPLADLGTLEVPAMIVRAGRPVSLEAELPPRAPRR